MSNPQYTASMEYILLEIILKGAKAVLGVVYCPPTIDYFSSLETLLESVCSDYTHHLIMGDLNTCLLQDSSRASKLLKIVKSVNFSILPSGPTHFTSTSSKLLDLILTSSENLIASHGQLNAPGFSHHDLIYASLKMKSSKLNL